MKEKDKLLVRALWKISKVTPDPVERYSIRLYRRLLQLKGQPASKRRLGVVAMLHTGRCGSTVLANMLDQNSKIYWDGKTSRKAHELYGAKLRKLDTSTWLKKQFSISGARFYGFEFKILKDQYARLFDKSVPEILEIFKSGGVNHFILLNRRNSLNQAISHYSGINSKVWHISQSPGHQNLRKTFSIDFDNMTTGSGPGLPLLDYLYEIENTRKEIRNFLQGEKLLELEYERDILENSPIAAYQKVCKFLEISAGDVSIKNEKVLSLPPSEIVQNYDDAVNTLSGTKFEWMLDNVN